MRGKVYAGVARVGGEAYDWVAKPFKGSPWLIIIMPLISRIPMHSKCGTVENITILS